MPSRKKRRIFTWKNKARLPTWLLWILARTIGLVHRTLRIRYIDPAGVVESGEPWPVIFLFWHNRILFTPGCFPARVRHKTAVLTSASRDGQYAAGFARQFGMEVVRGSSSRGGMRALRELKRTLDTGTTIAIPVDGPRGPRYEIHPGAAFLSQICGCQIVPIMFNTPSRWELGSWDRAQIPKPFSRAEFRVGEPFVLPPECAKDRERAAAFLKERMLSITDDSRKGARAHNAQPGGPPAPDAQ